VTGEKVALLFKVAQTDLGFQSEFPEPAFNLFRDTWALQRQLFATLARHGLRLTDIRPERGSGSLGDFSIVCFLFNFSVTVRIRLERIEIVCLDLARVAPDKLNHAGVDVLEAIRSHLPGASFKTHTLSLGLHGTLEGMGTHEFISRFVMKSPENLGSPIGSGVVFYYGPEAERLTSSVTLDLSALIAGGLYLRAQTVWDAQRVNVGALPNFVDKHIREVLLHLGLKLEEG
jgi:hypothetical protein